MVSREYLAVALAKRAMAAAMVQFAIGDLATSVQQRVAIARRGMGRAESLVVARAPAAEVLRMAQIVIKGQTPRRLQ